MWEYELWLLAGELCKLTGKPYKQLQFFREMLAAMGED